MEPKFNGKTIVLLTAAIFAVGCADPSKPSPTRTQYVEVDPTQEIVDLRSAYLEEERRMSEIGALLNSPGLVDSNTKFILIPRESSLFSYCDDVVLQMLPDPNVFKAGNELNQNFYLYLEQPDGSIDLVVNVLPHPDNSQMAQTWYCELPANMTSEQKAEFQGYVQASTPEEVSAYFDKLVRIIEFYKSQIEG